MRRLLALLLIPLIACSGLNTPPPSTPTPASAPPTAAPPTALPATSAPTDGSTTETPTDPPADASTFPDPAAYAWQPITGGLIRPVDLQPDGSGRLFIVEKIGHIHVYQNGALVDAPFLNIEDRVNDDSNEMGLLGLAFHPDFTQNGYFYVNYTGSGGDTFVSRFQASGDSADPSSELNLLRISQPFRNHNGGALTFGPDGYLYIGTGDGGSAGDPQGNGQSLNTLLGKILRIDVDSAQPYAIPADNPFGNEIWHYGLRNPWRISFDTLTGDLYIADVGQNVWEEINVAPAGSRGGLNFGWDYYEGNHEYEPKNVAGEYAFPAVEYSHAEGGCSVTGGYVYRGSMPEWNGIYLYGDYCTGYVWGLINVNGQWQARLMFEANIRITSFGQDESGEIYLLGDGGEVLQLVRK